jgi:hypothetical protein
LSTWLRRPIKRSSLQCFPVPSSITDIYSPELLDAVIEAHGGRDQWNKIHFTTVRYNFSGAALDLKGYPGNHLVTVTIDARSQRTVIQGIGDNGSLWIYTPSQTAITSSSPRGPSVQTQEDPRSRFVGHERTTLWDDHHLAYFVGYSMWYYLTTPFIFRTIVGFRTRELPPHTESDQTWRVLEVTFPDSIPTHSKVQKFYYNKDFLLCRIDYTVEVMSSTNQRPVSHYCYRHKEFGGIIVPTLRRIQLRDEVETTTPSSFVNDIISVDVGG